MAKLKLEPNPTFDYAVAIPVPGGDPVRVRFTFRHRSRTDVLAWVDGLKSSDTTDVDQVMAVCAGWELDDAFTRENVEALCENYGGASRAILDTYMRELRGAREKN
jgi:hypothetical protein